MGRLIKFRGLDYKGNWQYGSYYVGCMYPTSFTGHYVNDVIIYENTVGQFTGLHDKNGKEIYEGDIVEVLPWFGEDVVRGNVIFSAIGSWQAVDSKYGETDYLHEIAKRKSFKIIGNIHETPELINK